MACLLLLLSLGAIVLQGYHPGAEDDAVYLSAIKKDLRPSLYPFNDEFFTVQMQVTVFDKAVAASTKITRLPVAYVCLAWQIGSIWLLLASCWRVCSFCFATFRARVAGVLTIACLLTLPVAGTALYISDEHLHPRIVATAAILFAVAALQRRKPLAAGLLLSVALLLHLMMAAFGISFCLLYVLVRRFAGKQRPSAFVDGGEADHPGRQLAMKRALTLGGWLIAPQSAAWQQAVRQHSYYLLTRWEWYEWLGALAPPVLLWLLARFGRQRGKESVFQLAATICLFSVVQLAIALALLLPPGSAPLLRLQPMRYLHLTFLLMFMLAGATLGEYFLRARIARWLLVFLPLAGVNGYAQRLRYPATRNLELPWLAPQNPWLKAFAWVRTHTPEDAVFALDPGYLQVPGEDHHSFRALAERSSLVDGMKDAAVVTQVPILAATWVEQLAEQKGWATWSEGDFAHLAATTPVSWVVVAPAQSAGLNCPYQNATVAVCRLR